MLEKIKSFIETNVRIGMDVFTMLIQAIFILCASPFILCFILLGLIGRLFGMKD
jgi:hypothetical protein